MAIDSHTTAGEVRPEKDSLLRFRNPPFQLYLSTVLMTEPRVSSMLGTLTSFSCGSTLAPSLRFVALESQRIVVTSLSDLLQ